MTTAISVIAVPDMHCSACAARIRQALDGVVGIDRLDINPTRRQVIVRHDPARLPPAELLQNVQRGEHSARLADVAESRVDRVSIKRLGVAGVLAMQIMMLSLAGYLDDGSMPLAQLQLLRSASLVLSLPMVLWCAQPFFVGAWRSISGGLRGASMDVPVALAIAVAFGASALTTLTGRTEGEVYFDCVAMFTFLLLLARWLATGLSARFAIDDDAGDLLPARCIRVEADSEREVPVSALAVGDVVRVLRGSALPADGRVCAGVASVDESVLTGESVPVRRVAGEPVFAATVNCGDPFEMRVEQPADAMRFREVARLAESAAAAATSPVQLADRLATWFVLVVLLLAGATLGVWLLLDAGRALPATLAVLVVACPCALALATPAAVTAALLRLRRSGIVVTRASALTSLAELSRVFFDKTGTLTTGAAEVVGVHPLTPQGPSAARCLAVAAALQRHASHPWASAFVCTGEVSATDVKESPGAGVAGRVDGSECRIGSAAFCGVDAGTAARCGANVWLAIDDQVVCGFEVADELRPGALATIAALAARGLRPTLLSGDRGSRCDALAEHLDVHCALTPEDKHAQLVAAGGRTLMVGDGINDLPVMAAADVSAAFVDARAIVRARADLLLLGRRVDVLTEALDVARATRRITRQNLAWALVWNLLAIPAAATGLITPALAALGMASSSLLVTLNASRLLGRAGAAADH